MITKIKKGTSRKKVKELLESAEPQKSSQHKHLKELCGALKIKEDALALQKKWRDEWE